MDCDVLVIGAGIIGLSSAFRIKESNPEKRILVIDKCGGPGQGNSAKSEGGFRNIFTSETNFLLADSTIDWFCYMERELEYDLKLSLIGYLWLLSDGQYESQKTAYRLMEDRGVEMRTFAREDLEKMIPYLVTDFEGDEEAELLGLETVDIGVQGIKCGCLDVDALVRAYEKEFIKLGGEVAYSVEAKNIILKPSVELGIPGEPFVWQDKIIAGAKTSRGDILAETTIAAAGVWSETLLDPIGFDSLIKSKKRQLFAFKDPKLEDLMNVDGFNRENVMPLTILPKANILFRPELQEGSIWLACADNLGRSFGLEEDPQAEEDYYTNNLYYVLVKYFPCFEDLRPVNMWAGQYAINGFDEMPVVTSMPGMVYVGAASGSGIMKCDALGRIAAAVYEGEEVADLYGGRRFPVGDLGIQNRKVEREKLII